MQVRKGAHGLGQKLQCNSSTLNSVKNKNHSEKSLKKRNCGSRSPFAAPHDQRHLLHTFDDLWFAKPVVERIARILKDGDKKPDALCVPWQSVYPSPTGIMRLCQLPSGW